VLTFILKDKKGIYNMNTTNPFAVLQNEAPGVAAAFNNLIAALTSSDGLDSKTRQLIYIGIKTSQGDTGAVSAHVPMAKSDGATREEIRDTILLSITVSGVKGVVNCLIPALETYDNTERN
jgi:alkylhydroperoxidase/carboxymuconolactone decarboxylase family protein YurZ